MEGILCEVLGDGMRKEKRMAFDCCFPNELLPFRLSISIGGANMESCQINNKIKACFVSGFFKIGLSIQKANQII